MTAALWLPALAQYRPLLDPLPVDRHWLWLLLPLAALIALAYKAIKLDDLADLPRQTGILTIQIVLGMAIAAGGLWVIVELV
ncbi:MAG: hypothetical protein WD009_02795 [Phycisphaeraceae bacterium]